MTRNKIPDVIKGALVSLKENYSQLESLKSLLTTKNEAYKSEFIKTAKVIVSNLNQKSNSGSFSRDGWINYRRFSMGDLHLSSIKEDLKSKLGLSSFIPPHKLYCHYKEINGGSGDFRYEDFIAHHIVYCLFNGEEIECSLPSPNWVTDAVIWVIDSVCADIGIDFLKKEITESSCIYTLKPTAN